MKTNRQIFAITLLLLLFFSNTCISSPCEFKGIVVGEKYTWTQVMSKLNIKRFKLNPDVRQVMVNDADKAKYGVIGADERSLWRIGPYCLGAECYIPYGVEIQPLVPAYIRITYGADNLVTDIKVQFSTQNWQFVAPNLIQEYGSSSSKVEDRKFEVRDQLLKSSETVSRIMFGWKFIKDEKRVLHSCEISAANYDTIFKHYDPLGPYQSSLVISLTN